MAAMGSYDPSLQMFVQNTREPDMSRLAFLRWLAEMDRLEHKIAGPSSGPLAVEGMRVRPGREGKVNQLEGRSPGGGRERGR